jgi:hypothetical protein
MLNVLGQINLQYNTTFLIPLTKDRAHDN